LWFPRFPRLKIRNRRRQKILKKGCTSSTTWSSVALMSPEHRLSHRRTTTSPKTVVHADRRFVDNGRVICSAGIAAGIDMSLHVVSRLLGEAVAGKTAWQMEYQGQ
jgi:hypothetical protein